MSNAKEAKANIRSMERRDIHDVLALDRKIRGSEPDVMSYKDMASINPGTPPDMSFVAEVDGKIVGFSINRSWFLMVPLTEVCIIHAILVHPDYQGRGIGRKLIQSLLYHCQMEDISTVRMLIPEGNKELQALFEREGFKRSPVVNFDKAFEVP
jgi:ribosomal protein S18 acetylase RimI-like enzyme